MSVGFPVHTAGRVLSLRETATGRRKLAEFTGRATTVLEQEVQLRACVHNLRNPTKAADMR
jgi:hypothetical protein